MRHVIGLHAGENAGLDVRLHHRRNRRGVAAIADQTQRLGGAPLNDWRLIREGRKKRRAGSGIADQSQRERRHLSDIHVRVGKALRQRLNTFRKADTANRQGGARAHTPVTIRQQSNQVGRRSGCGDGRFGGRCGPENRRGWWIRISQQALILEAHHPAYLLLPRNDGGSGRRHGGRNG